MSGLPLVLLAAAVSAAPPSIPKPETDGGAETIVFHGEVPHPDLLRSVVKLGFLDPSGNLYQPCTGVLIAPNVAATAAHCWFMNVDGRRVRLEPYEAALLGAGGARRPAAGGVVHPDYGYDENVNDVGVVAFLGAAPAGAGPAELLDDESALQPGVELFFIGAGGTEKRGRSAVRQARMPVLEAQSAEFKVSGRGVTGACVGDSGGPAFLRDGSRLRAAGLASTSKAAECRGSGNATFMAVPRYREWLLANARAEQARVEAR